MKIIDFLTSPWAIMPEKLIEMQEIYSCHLRGDKIDIPAIEARLGRPLANEQRDYEIQDGGVAVLTIDGVITPKANLFSKVSGMASAQNLTQQVESMAADPNVRSVVLDIDSPGGSVLGIPALAEAISALASQKPTVSVCTGTMCSAGYWVGSAANAVYISGATDYVGSIGVVATHSYNPKRTGAQVTEITAGKYKRMASDNKPLDTEGEAYIRGQIDHIYSVFVDTVAKNRKVSAEAVLENMADGKVFIGSQAIDAGLVDGVSTVSAIVAKLADNPGAFANRRKAKISNASVGAESVEAELACSSSEPVLQVADVQKEGVPMSIEEVVAKFEAESPEAAAMIRAAGAAAERDRIAAVREQSMPGHEALIEQLALDGKTTGPEAAVKVLAAERGRLAGVAAQRDEDAPGAVADVAAEAADEDSKASGGISAPTGFAVDSKQAKLDADARAYMTKNPGASYLEAVKAVS